MGLVAAIALTTKVVGSVATNFDHFVFPVLFHSPSTVLHPYVQVFLLAFCANPADGFDVYSKSEISPCQRVFAPWLINVF